MSHRAEWKRIVDDMRKDVVTDKKTVEILSGPCAGMVIKSEADVREYAKRLDLWMFPPEARAQKAPRPLIPIRVARDQQ
jgi:hypothetical protein